MRVDVVASRMQGRRRWVMALAILAELPELTREQYELVAKKVNEAGTPAGALVHAGGPVEGGYRTLEVWETQAAADAFYGSDRYREAVASITSEPRVVMTWPVHGLDVGSGWRATG
jgi:quinol monooxygenase YgiN